MGESAVSRAPHADESDLLAILPALSRRAHWLALRHRIPPQDAEDLVQQALLALVCKYDHVRNPEAWLLGTVRNKCRRYWRLRRHRRMESLDPETLEGVLPTAAPEQEHADLVRDLERLLDAVPGRCRAILRYRYALGLRATEIGELLGCPASTVRQASTRCLRALRLALESGPQEGGRAPGRG